MGKVTAEEMQELMYGNSNNTARSGGSSPEKVSASEMENLMAPYRSQEIKHTVLSPSTQPTQAAPAGASSRKQSDAMKEQLDAIKKQRDDAAIKAGAYMRAGNMPQQAKEQQKIANKAAIEYENAYTQWKNQRNAEAVEDYDPSKNKFKAGTATLASLQDFGQSFMQGAGVLSHYLGGGEAAYRQAATSAKNLMDKGVAPKEAFETAGLVKKDAAPITDYKTVAELKREKDRASVGTLEGLGLDAVGTVSGMAIPAAVTAITKSPEAGLLLMSVSSLGHKYADAYEKYGNGDLAFMLGLGAGAATYTTEQIGGVFGRLGGTKLGQAATKKLMSEAPGLYSVANSVGGKWLRDAISEGVEEGAEDIVNYAIEKSLTGESDEMDNFGYDMLLGALAGGVLGGGNAAMRSVTYNRLGKALNASPAAVAQQVQEGMEKGAGTAPAIYAAEVQKNPSNQMVGRLYEANLTYDAESGLSKIQNDITQVSINEIKAMVSKADALAQAAQKLNVEATPQAVATAITDAQRTQSIKTAEDSVGQAFAPTVDNPANAGEKAYNSALAGVAANQGVAARINNDPAARQAFSQLTGVQFSGNTAQDIAAIEVATQNIAKSGKQAISQAEYAQRVTAAGEQAAAQFDADMQAQAEQMQRESEERWLSVEQNTITDVDGKRHIKEITNTDVRGNTEIGYKKAEIPGSKKKTVAEVNNAAKYLGKTIVWFEGAVQVNGQYRLTNGYRAPDGTIYVNINSRDPLMVTFGHEMFHDLVADSKYSGMIDTLVENPDYADMVKGMMNAKTELYERNGIELDPDAAAEEVAADISGDLLGSRDMLEYIGARNTEAATGIKGFLNRILKKLKGKPSAQEAYNRLSESQKALLDGMEDGARNIFADPAIGEDVKYSIREEAPPEKTILGYKVFVVKDGKLYPPMVANPNAEDTPVGVWLNADIGERAPDSKTGRMQVKAGGKGTQGGSGSLAFRPGWHLGEVPVASQFDRLNPETGKKELFPSNFVWAECLVAADIDYQEEAMSYGYTKSGKFQHSLAGLPKLPVDGYYKYRTNPRPDTVPWLITGAMKVNRILSDSDVAQILESKGITPPKRQGGEKTLEQLGLGKYADGKFSLIGVSNDGLEIYETSLATQQLSESQKKKQYLALIKNQYRGRTARLERNGHVVYVRPDIQEAGKPIYGDRRSTANGAKALRNSLAEGDVFDLLENAEYDRSSRDTKNHKNADYFDYYVKTVQIDGKVYDLVADVKRAYGNSDGLYYTLYLVDNATKKAVVSQRPQTLGSSEPITASEMGSNSFSADMVPQSDTAVNNYSMQNSAEDASGKHSLMDIPAMDSTGRELSAEQREYFFGSKVVDAEGRLKPVYHGSPAVFTEFSPDFMSQHGSSEGQGFYFTDYKPMAEGYQKDGGQLLEGYLDIKKPLSDSEITLTRAEVKKLLQAVDPTGDEVLVNYDPAGGIGYPSKTWYNRAMDATVKAAMEYSDSDSEILAEIANGGAGTGAVLEAARNTLGYDGYIVEGKYDNATVYVAFDSSQFKNIDNTAPTESKDIRYSLMKDAQYMADIDRVVSEATEKANDELKAAQAEVKDIRQQLADYRQQATAEAKMNDRWRDAETKLLTEIAAAKEREKAAKARAEFMAKYDALSKQYRADLRANNRQVRDKYNEKLSEAKDEFNRRRAQDRIDRVVREDRAKSKARLRTAEQKSTTTEDVAKVLTEMPKKDKETFKAKAAKDWRTFKRQWINTKDELERFGNEVGDSRIMYAANNVGQASAAAQYSIGGAGQYDLNGKKIGDKNLMQVFEPAKKAGLTDEFYTYLLHEHNVDRMSVRENAQRQLAELRAKLNKEVNGFAEMTDENIATAAGKDTTLTKAYTEAQIAAAKQYKQFQAWAEKQFDKPVFGSSVTADDSRAAAADLLDAHPEFEKWAKDVYAYLDGLMEVRKQGGLVSADMAQYMKELYPHYVPTYRDMASTSGGYSNPNSVAVNSTIKSAKGGNQDIMPLIDSIARQTLQTFSAAKKNILGNMLYEDAMDTTRDISEYIQSVTEEGDLVDLDADSAENLKNTLRIWVDGKPVTLHMSEAMADGFRPIEQSNSFGMKALRSINSTFKKLVTQWNPVFIVRNFVRDAQSALYFTHYSNATFVKNYGKAVKEIATNGKYWQLYQAMGGKGTTYYDPKTGLSDRYHFKNGAVDKVAGGLNRVIDILSFANEAVEQYPRLAEFISTMEDTGDVQQALYNAADITTNFGRGGFAARKLNASLVPFFNPGMQGLSKNIRNVIDRRGWKEIGQLISRLLINGVAPGIIMGLLYDGLKEDDDYKELSNYIKDSNILIKIGDNKFIKVPMGREPSVITAFTNRMWRWLKGEPASSAFAGYPSFAIEQIAPNNPLTNNIFAGITAMSTNKTWYGGDIVSSYMEEKPDYLQYDESTDAFSIWLGEITRHGKNGIEGLSPKKVNYLIDQYSGFIGDWLLPTLSKKADVPAVVKAFVVDSVRQNRLGSDFYDALDEAKQVKETELATAADDATYSYLYKQSKAASEITKQLKEIYNSGEKTRKEKMSEARDLLELRNEIYRKALLTVGTYEETAKSIGSADSDVVKREANRKAFGAEYALKTYNKDVGEKAAEYVAQGVTYDQYYAAYFAARGITGDKDENGKTITNSASRKKKEAIDKAVPGASTKQKHLLYEALGVSEKVW